MAKAKAAVGDFPETIEKDILRARDLSLLQALAEAKGRRLRYYGLSGVHAYDVVKWRDVLDYVTVVERPFKVQAQRTDFEGKVICQLTPYFNGNIQIAYADIWDHLSSAEYADLARAPDVVNLDFCGGLLNYTKLDYPKQKVAFQGLFDKGRRDTCDFLLVMTLMPRDQGKKTYKEFLNGHITSLTRTLASSKHIAQQLADNQAFHEKSNLTLFKACLPIMLDDIGRSYNYRVRLEYCRLYTKMIHLVFRCTYVSGVLGLAGDHVSTVRVLNLPIFKLEPDGTMVQQRTPQIVAKHYDESDHQ